MEPTLLTPKKIGLRRYHIRILIVAIFIFAGFLAYINEAPRTFPTQSLFSVNSGDSLTAVTNNLKEKHIIRSALAMKVTVILFGGEQKITAGDYFLGKPISLYSLVARLIKGKFDLAPIKVTIPEGLSMQQMSVILAAALPDFSVAAFMKYYPQKEGYFFPDTYLFMPNATTDQVVAVLQNNFNEKIKTVDPAILTFGRSEKDVVTMASILEKEANTIQDWSIISGILWKRIKIGMPLEVDSTLGYVTAKTSSELTMADLKSDSLYNTYTHKGLPPTPISNPGLGTIIAAATPTTTPYLYYLSDKNGVIHYAATFADHIKNRQKYLQ